MLETLGLDFEVRPSGVSEARHPDESPSSFAERVARDKALAVVEAGCVVLAADTVVVHRGVMLGKPGHPHEARSMLERLSGDRHTVVTGVAVARCESDTEVWSDTERTAVRFVELTDTEIGAYVDSGEPMDKAGAYGDAGSCGCLRRIRGGEPVERGRTADGARRQAASSGRCPGVRADLLIDLAGVDTFAGDD